MDALTLTQIISAELFLQVEVKALEFLALWELIISKIRLLRRQMKVHFIEHSFFADSGIKHLSEGHISIVFACNTFWQLGPSWPTFAKRKGNSELILIFFPEPHQRIFEHRAFTADVSYVGPKIILHEFSSSKSFDGGWMSLVIPVLFPGFWAVVCLGAHRFFFS